MPSRSPLRVLVLSFRTYARLKKTITNWCERRDSCRPLAARDAACGRGRRFQRRGGCAPSFTPEGSRPLLSHVRAPQEDDNELVRKEGLEPSRCYPQVPETCASTSSATFAGRQG